MPSIWTWASSPVQCVFCNMREEYCGGYHGIFRGIFWTLWGVQYTARGISSFLSEYLHSTEHPPQYSWYPPHVSCIFSHFTANPPEHSKYPQGSHDTLHGNEHSHGTQGISQFYHDIPYDTEPPSWYSRYSHGTQDIPTVLNTLHGTEHTLYVVILVDHLVRLPILDREGYTADLFTI